MMFDNATIFDLLTEELQFDIHFKQVEEKLVQPILLTQNGQDSYGRFEADLNPIDIEIKPADDETVYVKKIAHELRHRMVKDLLRHPFMQREAKFVKDSGKMYVDKDSGAYLPSKDGLSDIAIKNCMFNISRAYRHHSYWLMNMNTAKSLVNVLDIEGLPIVDERLIPKSGPNKDIPPEMLNRKIIVNETMPDVQIGEIPIILAATSRGYTVGTNGNFEQIEQEDGKLYVRALFGGGLVQQGCMRGVRII